MKILFNTGSGIMCKRTLDNWSLIKKACNLGHGKCEGYADKDRDEPTDKCKDCKPNTMHEE